MSGGDEAELEALQNKGAAAGADLGSAKWATRGKVRDAEQALAAHTT